MANCNFTEAERAIIEMRRGNVSLVGMSLRLNMSQSSVSDKLASIRKKMEELDKYAPFTA